MLSREPRDGGGYSENAVLFPTASSFPEDQWHPPHTPQPLSSQGLRSRPLPTSRRTAHRRAFFLRHLCPHSSSAPKAGAHVNDSLF